MVRAGRRGASRGRLPAPLAVLFGSACHARLEHTGAPTIPVNEVLTQSDRLVCTMKGPASEIQFEVFFARDAARTPLLVRAPFAIGNFSMELLR